MTNVLAADPNLFGVLAQVDVQLTSEKGAANGYAPLDASAKVQAANLPAAGGVTSLQPDALTALSGAVQLVSGANVTLTESGQAITIAAAGGGGTGVDAWRAEIAPFLGYTVVQGTWAVSVDSAQIGCGFLFNSTAALNDELTWPIVLSAGTWRIDVLCETASTAGITTILLGTTSVGAMDNYSAALTKNVQKSITGISVATSAVYVMHAKMATKNASATTYRWNPSLIVWTRTA